ncbi:Unknown protein sequence [Pseudomonas syringae pv. cilantro]|uniref:Uncharacterized protein n=1 Tax=Pseudomonas syringae pv. cilantro TaxID=81035 RepID=A0A0N0GGY6_PSESX|nr:Unknown protein sequence [Pseudomonas syringae pv. cilantro]
MLQSKFEHCLDSCAAPRRHLILVLMTTMNDRQLGKMKRYLSDIAFVWIAADNRRAETFNL